MLTVGTDIGYAGWGHDQPGDSSDLLAPHLAPPVQPHDGAATPVYRGIELVPQLLQVPVLMPSDVSGLQDMWYMNAESQAIGHRQSRSGSVDAEGTSGVEGRQSGLMDCHRYLFAPSATLRKSTNSTPSHGGSEEGRPKWDSHDHA